LAYADNLATAPAATAFNALALGPREAFAPQMSLWASAYGGAGTISGNGSGATTSSQVYGFATGLDYQLLPDTTVGLTLGGGGTSWQLGQGLGSGRADIFRPASIARTISARPIFPAPWPIRCRT
jgi:outer membrane autotransporter protein